MGQDKGDVWRLLIQLNGLVSPECSKLIWLLLLLNYLFFQIQLFMGLKFGLQSLQWLGIHSPIYFFYLWCWNYVLWNYKRNIWMVDFEFYKLSFCSRKDYLYIDRNTRWKLHIFNVFNILTFISFYWIWATFHQWQNPNLHIKTIFLICIYILYGISGKM